MPVYPYRCEAGHEVEVLHAAGGAPGPCPQCGAALTRVWAAPAVHFKGKGFYATDVGSERQRRFLDRAAEQGANDHDDKLRAQRAERAKAKAAEKPAPPPRTP
ncbi:FmdB family zinc ribbon protein [Conexibacter sp. SYSU D00693]|uniref:FmdB family zinc ribbon protein n=1 Tax=Conexibacter sp. SYSU D00693 TaxID=2812560 RepID=UPI00196B2163|nr:FmdB family zinc ribbon protein [Conexibacter sp. SYSU D00693]